MKSCKLLAIFLAINVFVFLPWDSTTKAEGILDFWPAILAASQVGKQGPQYDNDHDGYSENQGDCNDKEKSIYPGAAEICGDGIDQDCSDSDLACGAAIPTVTSAGQVWMDRNLGASRVAISLTDSEAYGDLYQWGRLADGHEKRNSPSIIETSSKDVPGHGNFLSPDFGSSIDIYYHYDWRTPQSDNLWQGVTGTNTPCPSGFRLPTVAELEVERASWISNDAAGAFASPLKLVMAGYRCPNGDILDVGSSGLYWSSAVTVLLNSSYGKALTFFSSLPLSPEILATIPPEVLAATYPKGWTAAISSGEIRSAGESVRCIKE